MYRITFLYIFAGIITILGTETRDQTWKVETEVKETVASICEKFPLYK